MNIKIKPNKASAFVEFFGIWTSLGLAGLLGVILVKTLFIPFITFLPLLVILVLIRLGLSKIDKKR